MLRQKTRKITMIIATVVFACVAVAACGNTGSAGNDAIRAKEVAATRAVVTTAAEKTEATTTTTSSTETTTSKSKATTTTTTTTAATTTAEPETSTKLETSTESKAETTESATETIESSATETTESEATTTEEPKEDNPEGMYPLEECFRRKAEEFTGQKVAEMHMDWEGHLFWGVLENGKYVFLGVSGDMEYDSNELYSVEKIEKDSDFDLAADTYTIILKE